MRTRKNPFTLWPLLLGLMMPVACAKNGSPLAPNAAPEAATPTVGVERTPAPTATVVSSPTPVVPDPNLYAAIQQVLYQSQILANPNDPVTPENLATLTSLDLESAGVTSVEGLQYCTSLTWLEIGWNSISDLSPIAGLTGLNYLDISGNPVTSLAPVTALTQLTTLDASDIQATDFAPVTALTALNYLYLGSDQITTLPAGLSALTSLGSLDIDANPVSNLTPLEGMTGLWALDIDNCQVTDLSPVTTITNLEMLYAYHNPLTGFPNLSGLARLQYLDAQNCSLSGLTGLSGMTDLNDLYLDNNNINDIDALLSAYNQGSFHDAVTALSLSGNPLGGQDVASVVQALTGDGVNVTGYQP